MTLFTAFVLGLFVGQWVFAWFLYKAIKEQIKSLKDQNE